MEDIIQDLGELAIGTRLRRLSDLIMSQGQKVYNDRRLDFDPYMFGVFYGTAKYGPIAVTDLAERLRISHPATIHTLKILKKKGYIRDERDVSDKRKRLLSLTPEGTELLHQLKPTWDDIATAFHQTIQECEVNILTAIQDFENQFSAKSLSQRVKELRKERLIDEIEIVDWHSDYAHHWADINYLWVREYFSVEIEDKKVLDHPQREIIDKGGAIIFAKYQGEVAGTVGLKRINEDVYEMVKMGVLPKFKGNYIGYALGLSIIKSAKELGAKRVVLDSNQKLKPALRLYEQLGFSIIPCSAAESDYARCDISMELYI